MEDSSAIFYLLFSIFYLHLYGVATASLKIPSRWGIGGVARNRMIRPHRISSAMNMRMLLSGHLDLLSRLELWQVGRMGSKQLVQQLRRRAEVAHQWVV
jgi:hypothetical protein